MERTFKNWKESRQNLLEYLMPGDTVDHEMVDFFINVFPPATWTNDLVQMGEGFSINRSGKFVFMTLEKINDEWIFTGVKPKPETV
ncbi:hypothetical protein [Desulfospira joergensenii]|uniref:hypothetical protein n=1 Tax=Desulfospira joergensenii TaxID=53329 RepID=UPI0003B42366|nr:hypothetical protein [Desulfospira joergensenii]